MSSAKKPTTESRSPSKDSTLSASSGNIDNQNKPGSEASSHNLNGLTKSPQEKCTEISNELTSLENEIEHFVGRRNDKAYLKLEELLTRCLLRLDEIDRGDEKVNDLRKSLINFTHKLSDKLELTVSNQSNDANQDENST